MRFHVLSIPLLQAPDSDPRTAYAHLTGLASTAEAAGFTGFWVAEHHFSRYGGHVPMAGVLLAHLAGQTSTIRLGTAAAILPLRDPLTTLEEFAMVDGLSGGRLELGVGRGFMTPEFVGKGVELGARTELFDAGLDAIERYLSGHGHIAPRQDGGGDGPLLVPRPVQARVPVWIAVSTNLDNCRHAGAAGHGLMLNPYNRKDAEVDAAIAAYRQAWDAAGHPEPDGTGGADGTAGAGGPRVLINQLMFTGATTAEAETGAREAINSYLSAAQESFRPEAGLQPLAHGFDQLYPEKLLVGSEEQVSERLADWQDRGVTDVALMSHYGSPLSPAADESLARFASGVLPRFAGAAVPQPAR